MVRALLTMNAPPAALTVKGTDVPPAFVNVMFLEVPDGRYFVAGKRLATPS